MLSKRYESTKVDRRTSLHVPSGTHWSNSSDTHQVVEIQIETSTKMYIPFLMLLFDVVLYANKTASVQILNYNKSRMYFQNVSCLRNLNSIYHVYRHIHWYFYFEVFYLLNPIYPRRSRFEHYLQNRWTYGRWPRPQCPDLLQTYSMCSLPALCLNSEQCPPL